MKPLTRKEFTEACCKEIREMNDEELENVRKGLYTLYNKLKSRGRRTLDIANLNLCSAFLLDIACTAATESISRIKKDSMPY